MSPPDNEPRVLSGAAQDSDRQIEETVRPRRMREFVGQGVVKERLNISIEAAGNRDDALDHALFHGPPGLGKTTLAQVTAHELHVGLRQTSGPALERPGDLVTLLTALKRRDVLFIDEIHRLRPVVQETLYSAMEDYRVDIVLGEGPGAHTMRLAIKPFTLIGATTRAGLLAGPLRDRFGIQERLDLYSTEDLTRIVKRSAGILTTDCTKAGAVAIAERARGTPRVANRLLRRVRDYAEVRADGRITARTAGQALAMHNVHENGLDDMDRRLLRVLIKRFHGGPAGIEAIAAGLGEDRGTLEDVYEPFLLRAGFLLRTQRGRVAGPAAYTALGLEPPPRTAAQRALDNLEIH